MAKRPIPSCFDKAVALLSLRSHFRRQLETKLQSRRYSPEEIATALDRLEGMGYVDDHRTALEFVGARLARGPEGALRLRAELAKRGAPSEAIDAALAERLPDDDREPALEAMRIWLRRGKTDPKALARFLGRKGFSPNAVWSAVDALGSLLPGEEDAEPL